MEKIKNYSRIRKRFEKLGLPLVEIPNLLAIQTDSFDRFLQRDIHPSKRNSDGLQEAFDSIFPITDAKGLYLLEFIDYVVLKEKYNEEECIARNLSYQAPIKARMRLTVYDEEALKEHNEKRVKEVIEQDVFLGEIPLLTKKGTFIINGAERVIISHLHRSPGVFFTTKKHPSGKLIYSGKVIPNNGSWLEFTLDIYDTMYIHIDKRRKIPVSVLLRSVGVESDSDIRDMFYESEPIKTEDAEKRYSYEDVIDLDTGEVLLGAGSPIVKDDIEDLLDSNIKEIKVIAKSTDTERKILEQTLSKDATTNKDSAVKKIYNLIRPGEDPTVEAAAALVERMFFNEKRYNLGVVGRHKLNSRLELNIDGDKHVLTKEDILAIIKKIIDIVKDKDTVDDIDHLSNRRIRTVGELLQEQYLIGLNRIARIAVERMVIANSDEVTVHDLVNSNALISVIQSFFLTGQLSQFMEETNPLAAITHKRKLSALGPGGLTRERAGFEVRDVHYSHYGRVCPIETPEGPNIGLISSPAIYSRINTFGFLETPYIKLENGRVTDEYHYLDATQEDKYTIAQANIALSENREIVDEFVFARRKGEFIQAKPNEIDYMEVSPQQLVSVSAALIPFLDHDDANRALMGSNMQRQAVPLLNPQYPRVGTGMERIVARDSGVVARAPFDGVIEKVTSSYIDVKPKEYDENTIDFSVNNRVFLKKYFRTNQDTTLNQRPSVKVGQEVKKGEAISDGPGIDKNRLALGRNMLVAFMPWYGYNYEDAIILSENVAREDTLTSIYIDEQEVLVRNVKNGKEELAYDIPNVPTNALRNLDKTGIIRVGSVIKAGDIVVGKITPKSVDVDPSPEENLMRALFGDRAGDFTNTSLKAKPGMEGVVIDVKVFSRAEDVMTMEEDQKRILKEKEDYLKLERKKRKEKIQEFKEKKLSDYLIGEIAKNLSDEKTARFFIMPGEKITKENIAKVNFKKLNLDFDLVENDDKNQAIYNEIILKAKKAEEESENIWKKKKDRLKHGDELPYGVRKMVKVHIAKKRKIKVGDKMAGRHGNKGVISRISPIEDMPFMEDGTPVDIILNPLGVPSRMNIGQIFETHLGMAAKVLGFNVETPVFDGASIEDIREEMKNAKLPIDGKQVLYDGKTGEPFKERVTVGIIYMLKLNHLVDDKMHARSTGPYSLITQQPLGGKAQHGGQRLGEMEVWALEAYGASRLLEEMLTIKSDDVDGRTATFKAITSGSTPPKPGVPESFNVLVSELKSLGFEIEFVKTGE